MRILCVSDYVDPLVYNQNVRDIFPGIDAVLCAGDLPMDYVDFIVTVFNKPTYFIFGNHNLKEFRYYHRGDAGFVPQTPAHYSDVSHSHGAVYAGFRTIVCDSLSFTDPSTGRRTPLLIAGASGSFRYNKGLNQYTDRQMFLRLLLMVPALIRNRIKYGRYLDIFLTHASPRHIHDHEDPCHVGFEFYNWFIKKFRPAYMIHGHIHLYDLREERSGVYGGTKVVNAYAHCIIEFPSGGNLTETREDSR